MLAERRIKSEPHVFPALCTPPECRTRSFRINCGAGRWPAVGWGGGEQNSSSARLGEKHCCQCERLRSRVRLACSYDTERFDVKLRILSACQDDDDDVIRGARVQWTRVLLGSSAAIVRVAAVCQRTQRISSETAATSATAASSAAAVWAAAATSDVTYRADAARRRCRRSPAILR